MACITVSVVRFIFLFFLLDNVQGGFSLIVAKLCAWNDCDCQRFPLSILGVFPLHASPLAYRTQGGQGQGVGFRRCHVPFPASASGWNLHLDWFSNERLGIVQVQVLLRGQGGGLAY